MSANTNSLSSTSFLLWKNLPTDVQQLFAKNAKRIEFKRGEYIYRAGEQPAGMYFVGGGLVGLVIAAQSGKEHLLRFFRQNQFFGHRSLFSDELYHASAIALQTTWIQMTPKEVVLQAMHDHPALYKEVAQVLAKELRRAELQHVMILENEILARVAQALVYLKELHPQHNWTRQEIANFCASTVSTVIKALAQLEEMGLIVQEGRSIDILKREELIQLQEL